MLFGNFCWLHIKLTLWELTTCDLRCLKHIARKIKILTLCRIMSSAASYVLVQLCLSSFGLGGYKTWSRIYPYIKVLEVINKKQSINTDSECQPNLILGIYNIYLVHKNIEKGELSLSSRCWSRAVSTERSHPFLGDVILSWRVFRICNTL